MSDETYNELDSLRMNAEVYEELISGFVDYLTQIPGSPLDDLCEPLLERFDSLTLELKGENADAGRIAAELESTLAELKRIAGENGVEQSELTDDKLRGYTEMRKFDDSQREERIKTDRQRGLGPGDSMLREALEGDEKLN